MLTVDRWVSWEEAEALPTVLHHMGGWFGHEQRNTWSDYLDTFTEETKPYLIALRDEIVRLGLRRDGMWHQDDPHGAPVFSDGQSVALSQRAWGDLLAAVWESVDHLPYNYVDFYIAECTPEQKRADMEKRPWMYSASTSQEESET